MHALTLKIVKFWAALTNNCDEGRAQRAAFLAFAIRVASAGVAYLSQIALARWMGDSAYGAFVWVWVWVLILGGLAPLGLNVALIKLVPQYSETNDRAALRGLIRFVPLASFAVATLFALLGLAALELWGDLLSRAYIWPAYLALICLPMFAASDSLDCLGRAYGWIALALLPPFLLRPFLILAGMALTHMAGLEMSAQTAIGAAIAAVWLTGMVQILLVSRRLAHEVPAGPRRYEPRGWITLSLPILLVLGFELVLQNTDILVLSRYLPAAEVGIYFAALKTIGLVSFVHFAVGSAVANRISAYRTRGDEAALKRFVRQAANWTFWPSLAGAIALLVLGQPLLWLFGENFTQGYGAMAILAVGLLVRAAMGPAEFVLNMLGEQVRCAQILFANAALNIALNFALVPVFGLTGAAAATSLSLGAAAVLFFLVARRRLGLNISVWQSRAAAATS